MRRVIIINAPIAPPATAGTGREDLLLEFVWPGSPVPKLGLLLEDDDLCAEVLTGFLEGVEVTKREVSVDDSNGVIEGGSDEDWTG